MQTLTSLRVERDLSRQLVSLAAIHSKHATERRKIGWVFAALLLTMALLTGASAQITPSQDAYTNTADPTTNYGAKTLLDVESASRTVTFSLICRRFRRAIPVPVSLRLR